MLVPAIGCGLLEIEAELKVVHLTGASGGRQLFTVAFLRDGHGSHADFMASIDHVKCAIDLIEKERDYWKAKSKEYDAEMQMLIPQFSAKITTNYDDHQLMNVYTLFVQTELPYYRMSLTIR